MQEHSKYAVGVDIGSSRVKCVVAHLDGTGTARIIGVGTAPNSGMRKGIVVSLDGPAIAIDQALGEAERMGGYQVNEASVSINGNHLISTHTDGMIAVGRADHVIDIEDIRRIEDVATLGKIPPNREIIDVIPHMYRLDGQDNIKDPVGMTGTRLEMDAHVISALIPHLRNLHQVAERATLVPRATVVAGVAAAKAVLGEPQLENGVALIDIGASTTNIAIYEEGDLRFIAVIPVGGNNITNDLAIGLKTDPEIAEQIKLQHGSALVRREHSGVGIKYEGEILNFDSREIDEIIEARLDELFDSIHKEFRRAGMVGRLPSGVVLTGGTANMPHLAEYARDKLSVAAKIGSLPKLGGLSEELDDPAYAVAIGLLLIDEGEATQEIKTKQKTKLPAANKVTGLLKKFKI